MSKFSLNLAIFQALFSQCYEKVRKEGFASIKATCSYSESWTPEKRIATAKRLYGAYSMAHQAWSGIVHLERQADMDCLVCNGELPEVYTMSCYKCFTLLCPKCEAKLGRCPMCRRMVGFTPSRFIDFLILKRRGSLVEEWRNIKIVSVTWSHHTY